MKIVSYQIFMIFFTYLLPMNCKTVNTTAALSSSKNEFQTICINPEKLSQKNDLEVLKALLKVSDCEKLSEGLAQIQSLSIDDKNFQSLDLLRISKNLRTLSLRNNQITNIFPLSSLTSLKELNLENNKIKDLSGLSQLTHLEQLYLGHNRIELLNELSGLEGLFILNLAFNDIKDISPLEKLHKLKVIEIRENPITRSSKEN